MNRTQLRALLVKHEGERLKPYRDTVGKVTIGVGRNLDDDGISADEATVLLDDDINRLWHELPGAIACFPSLDDVRQHVLMDMAFNMGVAGLLKFTKMLAAIEARDFSTAADEMLSSAWAREVGARATELATMMRVDAAAA
jgi:lysozyme